MRLNNQLARRYLVGKKSANIINIITGLSVFGLATGTCVILLVMAVFNGLEGTILDFFNSFNPDLKITASAGKTIKNADSLSLRLKQVEGVELVAKSLEEVVLFEYEEQQEVGKIKGVTDNYPQLNGIDSALVEGRFNLHPQKGGGVIAGIGIGSSLALNVMDPFTYIKVYALTKESKSKALGSPFRKISMVPTGMFAIQQEYDNQYIFAPLDQVQYLLQKTAEVSAFEIRVQNGQTDAVQDRLQHLLGSKFKVENRYQQEQEFLRLMKVEKWLAFLMLSLAAMLVAFNMIGALWMIVIDKKKDISILKCMGMDDQSIRNIFLTLGAFIALLGISLGSLITLIIYFLQINYGLVGIPEGSGMTAYPVELSLFDFMITASIILTIGLLASIPAAQRAKKIPTIYRIEG